MGFLSKIFGGKGSKEVKALVGETIQGVIERSGLELSYDFKIVEGKGNRFDIVQVELFGPDEDMLTEKEGQLLDSFQLLIKRVLQHNVKETPYNVIFDSNDFRSKADKALVDLAEKLKGVAIEKGRSVYVKALPPKDRKIVHQYLSEDNRVKSRSVGDGLYKKIKIFPAKGGSSREARR